MFEIRWYDTGVQKVLQYRVKQDVTVWAGMPTQEQRSAMANFQWSPWIDVPTVESPLVNEITAESVSYLREISDCPMMECKKALTACRGDMVKAAEYLRTNRNNFYVR